MRDFKDFILENREDPCHVRYGKILFGELRNMPEKDTPEESTLALMLDDYLKSGVRSKKMIDALKNLQRCRTYFKKELIPSENDTVFRAIMQDKPHPMSRNNITLIEQSTKNTYKIEGNWDLVRDNPRMQSYYVGYKGSVYKPRSEVESWTDNIDSDFFTDPDLHVVSDLNTLWEIPIKKDEFIFDSKFLEELGEKHDLMGEHEVLRISNKPIRGIEWIRIYKEYKWVFLPDIWKRTLKHNSMQFRNMIYTVRHHKNDLYLTFRER